MKNLFLIFYLMTVLSASSQTSVYHPIPDTGIAWSEQTITFGNNCACSGMVCLESAYYKYFFNGEMIVDSLKYKLLYKTGHGNDEAWGNVICCPWCTNYFEFYFSNELIGGIRNDSAARKVFYIYPSWSMEELLYDFNLNLGDTLPITVTNPFRDDVVTSIDSIWIGDSYHKRFWISSGHDSAYISLIEGIGSDMGLLAPIDPPFEFSYSLNCVKMYQQTVYPDTLTSCLLPTSISENGKWTNFSVCPNPFHDFATITLEDADENTELRIINSLGIVVRHFPVRTSKISIDRKGLSNGMYYLQIIKSKGQSEVRKIVIE